MANDSKSTKAEWKLLLEDHQSRAEFWRSNVLILGGQILRFIDMNEQKDQKVAQVLTFGTYSVGLVITPDPMASMSEAVLPTPIPTRKKWPHPEGCSGGYYVIGGLGAGKSIFTNDTLDHDVTIRYGEPAEHYDLRPNVYHAKDVIDAVYTATYLAARGQRVTLDSLRTVVYGARGASTGKGVSSGLYTACLNISNFAAAAQAAVVIVINPMADVETEAFIYRNVVASTSGGWHLVAGQIEAQTFRGIDGRSFGAAPSDVFAEHGSMHLGSAMAVDMQSGTFSMAAANPRVDLEGPARVRAIVENPPFVRNTDRLDAAEQTPLGEVTVRKGTSFIAFTEDDELHAQEPALPPAPQSTHVIRTAGTKKKSGHPPAPQNVGSIHLK